MFWANHWVFFERTLNEWLRHMVGTFWSNLWKKPPGFFKAEPMGSLMGSFKTYSQLTHWSHQDQIDGYIENFPTIYLLGKVWVNCLKTLNKLSMYPPGKTPSAPSEIHQWLQQSIVVGERSQERFGDLPLEPHSTLSHWSGWVRHGITIGQVDWTSEEKVWHRLVYTTHFPYNQTTSLVCKVYHQVRPLLPCHYQQWSSLALCNTPTCTPSCLWAWRRSYCSPPHVTGDILSEGHAVRCKVYLEFISPSELFNTPWTNKPAAHLSISTWYPSMMIMMLGVWKIWQCFPMLLNSWWHSEHLLGSFRTHQTTISHGTAESGCFTR